MKLFDLEYVSGESDRQEMREAPDGDWARWEDVERLLREFFQIRAVLAECQHCIERERDEARADGTAFARKAIAETTRLIGERDATLAEVERLRDWRRRAEEVLRRLPDTAQHGAAGWRGWLDLLAAARALLAEAPP